MRKFDQYMPFVPSRQEVTSFINAIDDPKTRAMVILMYSAGLRVSEVCSIKCGHIELHSCSCRNRACPNCQSVLKEVWIDNRRSEVLDASYFHVVFTVPHTLNALFLANQKLLYSLLFTAASETLLTLSQDKCYLGRRYYLRP